MHETRANVVDQPGYLLLIQTASPAGHRRAGLAVAHDINHLLSGEAVSRAGGGKVPRGRGHALHGMRFATAVFAMTHRAILGIQGMRVHGPCHGEPGTEYQQYDEQAAVQEERAMLEYELKRTGQLLQQPRQATAIPLDEL